MISLYSQDCDRNKYFFKILEHITDESLVQLCLQKIQSRRQLKRNLKLILHIMHHHSAIEVEDLFDDLFPIVG